MEELIEKAKNGDIDALTEIFEYYKMDLYKIARTRLSCLDDIEDAIQDTILQTYDSIKRLKHTEYFKKWLITILIRCCNRIYSKRKKYNISFDNLEVDKYIRI